LAAGNRVYENTGGDLDLTSTVTDNAISIAWGDWDGDGDLDLAAGNFGQSNRVYENTGGDLDLIWASTETEWTGSIAWGDWDADGDLDLAVGNWLQPNRVYENTGGDLVLAWTSTETDYTWSVAWGDWDGDGDLDLAAGNSSAQPNRVYENIGGDLALAWTSTETDTTLSIAWGDWDGDGDLDLAAGSWNQPNRVYENGALNRPGRLPETPTSPVISQRPGATDAAFFHSTEECLHSPVIVPYDLVDEEGDRARRILPQYSPAGGGQWLPATEGLGGDGTEELIASAGGQSHVFVWDALADGVLRTDNLVFRITVPYQASTRLAGPIQRAAMSATSPPFRLCKGSLWLPDLTHVAAGESVGVPVNLTTPDEVLASVAFSLDYAESCLDPDLDDDGILDQFTTNVPADFTVTVLFDELDTDGEIDVSIADVTPPIASLTSGELLSVTFAAICPVTPPTPVDAPITISSPMFGNDQGQPVSGAATSGVVRIWPGLRGDCNWSGAVEVADLTAVGLEIFDDDGCFWADTVGGTFTGSPVGCDADASTCIAAADVICTNLLLFGLECGGRASLSTPSTVPRIVVTGTAPVGTGEPAWIHVRLEPNGAEIGSVAFSLDLDPAVFVLDEIDADSDGVPDRLLFPNGEPGMAVVSFDAADTDGELDLLLADLSLATLAAGVLVEIGLPVPAGTYEPPEGLSLSSAPPASFGTVTGLDVDGQVYIGEITIFSDSFESGDTSAWSVTVK
ncbi:MAG: hypothetical protein GY856_42120, partial [bacterium]|nr:hypothetical protein [bacterium]